MKNYLPIFSKSPNYPNLFNTVNAVGLSTATPFLLIKQYYQIVKVDVLSAEVRLPGFSKKIGDMSGGKSDSQGRLYNLPWQVP